MPKKKKKNPFLNNEEKSIHHEFDPAIELVLTMLHKFNDKTIEYKKLKSTILIVKKLFYAFMQDTE